MLRVCLDCSLAMTDVIASQRSRQRRSNPRTRDITMKARLIIDSTRRSADLFYLTGLKAPDPVIWLQLGRKRVLMLSELELDRARIEARADRFVALRPYLAKASRRLGGATAVHAAALFLKEHGASRVEVPSTFPSSMYLTLKTQ